MHCSERNLGALKMQTLTDPDGDHVPALHSLRRNDNKSRHIIPDTKTQEHKMNRRQNNNHRHQPNHHHLVFRLIGKHSGTRSKIIITTGMFLRTTQRGMRRRSMTGRLHRPWP